MPDNFSRFAALLSLSDDLIEQASKEDIAQVARVLALHVAHYRGRHGDIPTQESLEILRTETIDDEHAKVLADGMEVLSNVLKALVAESKENDLH